MALPGPCLAARSLYGPEKRLSRYTHHWTAHTHRYPAPATLTIDTEESLTVLRGLGLQVSTASSLYLRTPTTSFIPTTSIQDLFVHEAFTGFQVRFYLAIVVRGEDHVVVVFPTMLPRRDIIEEVWRGSKACLWERLGSEGNSKQDTASRAQ